MKKTRLISSLICIVFITTIFFGVYAANPGQDEPKNIVETDINLSDEPEVSPGTGDSMQQPEISAEPEENAEEENVQSAIPSPEVNDEVDEAEVPETEIKPETEQPKEAEATPEVYINEDGIPSIEIIDNFNAEFDENYLDVLNMNQTMQLSDEAELASFDELDINNVFHQKISSGLKHTIMINDDGTVSAWGDNTYGQLGNATTVNSIEPVKVQGLMNIVEVAAEDNTSFALDKEGNVYAWGRDTWGLCGDGTSMDVRNIPVNVLYLSDIVKISANTQHALALKANGDVYAWGTNAAGQLGNGGYGAEYYPEKIENIPRMLDVSAGYFFSIAVDASGDVWTWGNNNYCKLGFQNSGNYPSAVRTSVSDVKDVSAGQDNTVVLKEDGTVWTWGANNYGELGVTNITLYTPQAQQTSLTNISNIHTKYNYSIAYKSDKSVYAWGYNNYGQLGIGSNETFLSTPTIISDSKFDSVGLAASSAYAIDNDGNLYKWGYMPNTDISKYINGGSCVPLDIPTETRFVQVEAKRNSVVALDVNGDVYTWGDGAYDDLGHGNKDNVYYPKKVEGLPKIKQVAKGENHTLAVDVDGNVWGWGNNSSKEIDYNYSGHIITPVKLTEIDDVDCVSAGQGFSAAIKNDSSLWTWGQNYAGQLGIGGSKVNNVNKISGVDCFHSIVDCGESYLLTQYLYSNNDVTYDPYSHHCTMACGANNRGQLGKGDLVNSSVLSKLQDIEGYEVKDLSAGREHALALYSNGDVYSWGSNTIGQLGLGDKVDRMLPVKIQGVSNIKYIEAAYAHSMAITNSGNLYAWGEGRDGQLGIGVKETKRLPVLVQGIKNVSSVTGGSAFSIALDEKGKLWSFGSNAYGQLGVISSVPEKIVTVNNKELIAEYNNNNIRIEGYTGINGNRNLLVRILDPNNSIVTLEQIISDYNGYYSLNYEYINYISGTYQVIVSEENLLGVQTTKFNIKTSSEVDEVLPNDAQNINSPKLLSVQAPESLQSDSIFQAVGHIENSDTEKPQDITFIIALYNKYNNVLIDYSAVHSEIKPQKSDWLAPQIYIPQSADDYKINILICEGNDIRYGSMVPLTQTKVIQNNMSYDGQYISTCEFDGSVLPVINIADTDLGGTVPVCVDTNLDVNLQSISVLQDVDVNISLSNNGIYCENVIKPDCDIKTEIIVTNNRKEPIEFNYWFFVNTKATNSTTIFTNCISSIHVGAGETKKFSSTCGLKQLNLNNCSPQITMWGTGNIDMQPLIPPIVLSTVHSDFYGNTINEATELSILDCDVEGKIDYIDDIDFIKFIPKYTGSYYIYTTGSTNTFGTLYDTDMNTIIAKSSGYPESNLIRNDNFKIGITLERGKVYYLKVESEESSTGEYILKFEQIIEPNVGWFWSQFHLLNRGDTYYSQIGKNINNWGDLQGVTGNDINILPVWEYTKGKKTNGEKIKIGIVDGGIETKNQNFIGNISSNPSGKNFVRNNSSIREEFWHGTAVSGVVAARDDYVDGIVGVAPESEIVPLIVLDSSDTYTDSRVVNAINYASQNNIEILNISLQSNRASTASLKKAIVNVKNKILLVACAGNYGLNLKNKSYGIASINSDNLIVVANSSCDGTLNATSNYGGYTHIAAPGNGIISTEGIDNYGAMVGTSFSAPMVSGVAALLKAYYPDLTVQEVKNRIINTENVSKKNNLIGKVSSGGVLNAWLAFSNPQPLSSSASLSDETIFDESIRPEIIENMNNAPEDSFTNQIIVSLKENSDISSIVNSTTPNAKIVEELSIINSYVLEFNSIEEAKKMVEVYNNSDKVYYAEPNYLNEKG